MERPNCPRCAGDLVVAAPSGSPSEWVEELRGGNVPARALARGGGNWLCRSCGHRWDPDARRERWVPAPGDPLPDPDGIRAGLGGELDASEEPATNAGNGTSPGVLLRQAREARGHTFADAARGTKIWTHHLEALESDASLDEFPSPSYARFFLREYAEFLQLRPEQLLREFDARHPVADEPSLAALPDMRDRRSLVGGVMALSAAVVLAVITLLPPASSPDAELLEAAISMAEVHDSGRQPLSSSTPVRHGVRAVLRVNQPCWVRALADGEVVAAITLVPGERVSYRADRNLQLRLGNGGGVRLRVNGEPVTTGDPGEVVVIELSWQRGGVLIERG